MKVAIDLAHGDSPGNLYKILLTASKFFNAPFPFLTAFEGETERRALLLPPVELFGHWIIETA